MNSNVVIGIVVLILVIIGGVTLGMSNSGSVAQQSGSDGLERPEDAATAPAAEAVNNPDMVDDGETMDDRESTDMSEGMMADAPVAETASVGIFADYSEDKLSMAADGDVVLFFKADWCPSCRALERDIEANLDQIPADLAILEVNYDTATELRQRYGVTTQHTMVQVDANGEELKQWLGGNTLGAIVPEII